MVGILIDEKDEPDPNLEIIKRIIDSASKNIEIISYGTITKEILRSLKKKIKKIKKNKLTCSIIKPVA